VLTTAVHDRPPYNSKGQRTAMNDGDRIYRRGGENLLLALTPNGEGYAGVFDIGLKS
jgi:hypothetical protein